ncbi:MAG TPA: HAMP domain-containing sensor histidine kinase [Longimicrobiales bacterium]|nr:HAMP domain-containing sensor histidine kinase [Longimicrobiales bacterium]
MSWTRRLRALPLRRKVLVTVTGVGAILLGVTTYLSFGYWKTESISAAEAQALLAAASVHVPVEQALRAGRTEDARRVLRRLTTSSAVAGARVYAAGGQIVASAATSEEGQRRPGLWLPDAATLGSAGVARIEDDDARVRAFMPLRIPGDALLEVEFSLEPLQGAMTRGSRLAVALLFVSLLLVAIVIWLMLEREVVQPLERMRELMHAESPRGDELRQLEASVTTLMEREHAASSLAEEQGRRLAAQEQLAEVGQLAAEMAHEFKRPLATMHTALNVLEQEYALDGRARDLFEGVNAQIGHLSTSVQDLFALARPLAPGTASVDMRAAADAALIEVSGHPAVAGITLRRSYADDALDVRGDERRLQQVVQNLVLNAAEALNGEGAVMVSVAREGADVVLRVSDNGPGIPAEMIDHVLRPFYTTKPLGTGLGLPLVARIADAHGGTVTIESRTGEGTTVCVRLPALREETGGTG